MKSPENSEDVEALRDSVVVKAQQFLDEPREYHTVLFDGDGLLTSIAHAIRGHTYNRAGSINIGQAGYQWVTLTEGSTKRFGVIRPTYLVLNGEEAKDGEGRTTERLWHYDLYSQTYSPEEYRMLEDLLTLEPGQARDDVFKRLAEGQDHQHPNS